MAADESEKRKNPRGYLRRRVFENTEFRIIFPSLVAAVLSRPDFIFLPQKRILIYYANHAVVVRVLCGACSGPRSRIGSSPAAAPSLSTAELARTRVMRLRAQTADLIPRCRDANVTRYVAMRTENVTGKKVKQDIMYYDNNYSDL